MPLDLNVLRWNSNKSKKHTCGLLNLRNVMIMVMLNGILSSFFSTPEWLSSEWHCYWGKTRFLLLAMMVRHLDI